MFDFTPDSADATRVWTAAGALAHTEPNNLWASVEIPAGAMVRDAVGVSSSRQVKVKANADVHIVLDVTGTIG